jgi:hypothetical protein
MPVLSSETSIPTVFLYNLCTPPGDYLSQLGKTRQRTAADTMVLSFGRHQARFAWVRNI